MQRDPLDRRRPERLAAAFVASLLLHAILALFLFSTAVPSSQSSPESISGWQPILTVARESRPRPATPSRVRQAVVAPHAPVMPRQHAAQPLSAPPHPRILHELAKFAPTAPPNPTPAPEASAAPNPVPTQPQIAVSPAPLPVTVPTSVPTAAVLAASIKVPPTAAPTPRPSAAPSARPVLRPAAPSARPSEAPRPAPPLHSAAPQASATPGVPSPGPSAAARAVSQHAAGASPGPKPVASSGPGTSLTAKVPAIARPIQVATTPRPVPASTRRPGPRRTSRPSSLNQRLKQLIPTSAPPTPEPPKVYHNLANIQPGAAQEPTPPPDVLAATKFLYVENVAGLRWKHSPLGSAPEELSVKMYVTSVRHIGPVTICHGWLLRYPLPPAHGTYNLGSNYDVAPKPIVEPDVTYVCSGHGLQPFTPPVPSQSPRP